jgi:2-polyprenyl-3-methyl-5-hydroxy-6-metoxy-1,4-benzoquinol methylase
MRSGCANCSDRGSILLVVPTMDGLAVDLQRKHWNEWNAETREHLLDEISLKQSAIIDQWLEASGRNDLNIIEVGCGVGWLCKPLAKYGKVTATDLANEVLERAQKRMPSVKFVAGDFMTLPFDASSFDVVVSLEVLAHVGAQQAFINKLASLLRPGGYLMLATQNRFVIKYFNRVPPDRPGWLRNYVSRRELYKMAQPEFEVLQLFSVTPRANRGVMHIVNSRKVNWPIRALFGDRVEKLKERLGLGWTLMLLARKKTVGSTSGAEKETTALLWEARGGPKGFEPCRPA